MTRVAIIGTGFGGVAAAVRLKQAGVRDLVLFERAADIGGVWRASAYPANAAFTATATADEASAGAAHDAIVGAAREATRMAGDLQRIVSGM